MIRHVKRNYCRLLFIKLWHFLVGKLSVVVNSFNSSSPLSLPTGGSFVIILEMKIQSLGY